jgi:hypothetical protein
MKALSRDARGRVLIVVAVLLLVALAYLGAGAVETNRLLDATDRDLDVALANQATVSDALSSDPFKDASPGAPGFDAAVARGKLEVELAHNAKVEARIRAAQSRLEASDRRLRMSKNWLTLPEAGRIDGERGRLSAAAAGYSYAATALAITDDQLKCFDALYDFYADFEAATRLAASKDTAGALAAYPRLEQKLHTAANLVAGTHIPPQMRPFAATLADLLSNFKLALQATDSHDPDGTKRYLDAVDADLKKASTFDVAGFNSWEESTFKPLQDGYNNGLRTARSG